MMFFDDKKVDGSEEQFLEGLLELQYGQNVVRKLIDCSSSVSWAHDWPKNDISFWNAEAFMWSRKIEKKVKKLITIELTSLLNLPLTSSLTASSNQKNLDLGCGAYSYIPSIGFDFSSKMLEFNENCNQKVRGNVEEKLPFENKSFDSITAIFLLNYVTNYDLLFREVKRILKDNGTFVMILKNGMVNEWQRQKEVSSFSKEEWQSLLQNFFNVHISTKENLLFFVCRKQKPY